MQASVALRNHFRGAQQARQAPRMNVRELFCGSKITRNGSDEAERSERSPFGVVSAANDEKLAAAGGQVSGEAAPASGNALQPDRPPGTAPVLALKSCYPPGSPTCSCCNAKPNIKLTCDWKAEMNLTPAEREQALRAPHSKVATRSSWALCPRTLTDWHGRHGSSKVAV